MGSNSDSPMRFVKKEKDWDGLTGEGFYAEIDFNLKVQDKGTKSQLKKIKLAEQLSFSQKKE